MRQRWVRRLVLSAVVVLAACKGEAQVEVKTADDPAPRNQREREPEVADDSTEVPETETKPLVSGPLCLGRPNERKMQLAMNACAGEASQLDLQELRTICRADRDGECLMFTSRAIRAWDADREVREPAAADMCRIREKEELVASACHGQLGITSLVDLVKRCRRSDRICADVARTALAAQNPAAAAQVK